MNPACPACRSPTEPVRWHDVAGFACPGCAGHYIRPDALQTFLIKHSRTPAFSQMMETARDAPASPRRLECPDCRTKSYHVVRAGVVELDVCATCIGMYFDQYEATAYLLQTRATPTADKLANGVITGFDGLGTMIRLINDIFH